MATVAQDRPYGWESASRVLMSPMCSETMACEARDVDAGGLVYKLPKRRPLPLSSLNHVSRLCSDVNASRRFYRDLLGMVEVKRPDSFTFEGAWLLGSGIGIHLIQGNPPPRPSDINPQRDHVSFHSDDIPAVAQQLRDAGVPYVEAPVWEGPILVTQLFFHDPDNNMIEICDCNKLPVVMLRPDGAAAEGASQAHVQAEAPCVPCMAVAGAYKAPRSSADSAETDHVSRCEGDEAADDAMGPAPAVGASGDAPRPAEAPATKGRPPRPPRVPAIQLPEAGDCAAAAWGAPSPRATPRSAQRLRDDTAGRVTPWGSPVARCRSACAARGDVASPSSGGGVAAAASPSGLPGIRHGIAASVIVPAPVPAEETAKWLGSQFVGAALVPWLVAEAPGEVPAVLAEAGCLQAGVQAQGAGVTGPKEGEAVDGDDARRSLEVLPLFAGPIHPDALPAGTLLLPCLCLKQR